MCIRDSLTNVGNSFAQGGQDGYQKLIIIGSPSKSSDLNSPPSINSALNGKGVSLELLHPKIKKINKRISFKLKTCKHF